MFLKTSSHLCSSTASGKVGLVFTCIYKDKSVSKSESKRLMNFPISSNSDIRQMKLFTRIKQILSEYNHLMQNDFAPSKCSARS